MFQLSPLVVSPEILVAKGVGEKWPMNFAWNARLPRSIQGSFTCRKSTTWDRRLYFPSVGRRAEDFFALKNPTASAGFEPSNLGTKGQHATSRPPKPILFVLGRVLFSLSCEIWHHYYCLTFSTKPTDALVSKFILVQNSVSGSSYTHHQELATVHWTLVYVIQDWRAWSSWNCSSILILQASCVTCVSAKIQ
jgi:hypothetical protein